MIAQDSRIKSNTAKLNRKATKPLVQLPKEEEFAELLSRDVPLQTTSCQMNYSVHSYTRYSRTC